MIFAGAVLTFVMVLLTSLFILYSKDYTLAHEKGHLNAALSQGRSGLLIVVGGKKATCVKSEKYPTYIVPKKELKDFFEKPKFGGLFLPENDDVSPKQLLEVTKAGPRASIKWYLRHLYIFFVPFVFGLCFCLLALDYVDAFIAASTGAISGIVFVTIVLLSCLYWLSGTREFKKISKIPDGSKYEPLFSDGTKIFFHKQYVEWLTKYKEKGLERKYTYDEAKKFLDNLVASDAKIRKDILSETKKSITYLIHEAGKPDKVIKQFIDSVRYNNEKTAYTALAGEPFIPKLFEVNEEEHSITMEKIEAPTLEEYINSHGTIPYSFAKDMKYIERTMAQKGIINHGELEKLAHIYVDESRKSPKTNGIRIIDFDVCRHITKDNDSFKDLVDGWISEVDSSYAFLENPDDPSWQEFAKRFNKYESIVSDDIIEDFRKNMER